MITSLYRGGLGNQLFEVAAGYALSKDNDDEYAINPDLHREHGQGNHISSYINTIFKNFKKTDYKCSKLYKEPKFSYTEIPYIDDILLDGYFQSEKYFKNYRTDLNTLFGFDSNYSLKDVCTIHIRTGDYMYLRDFNVVTPTYFINAINLVLSLNSTVKFYIISDDNRQAVNYLPTNIDYEFMSSSELEDLRIMSLSDYAIISNSSFSWWGSYLGKRKITIAPDKWFNTDHDVSDIYRDDMIKVSV